MTNTNENKGLSKYAEALLSSFNDTYILEAAINTFQFKRDDYTSYGKDNIITTFKAIAESFGLNNIGEHESLINSNQAYAILYATYIHSVVILKNSGHTITADVHEAGVRLITSIISSDRSLHLLDSNIYKIIFGIHIYMTSLVLGINDGSDTIIRWVEDNNSSLTWLIKNNPIIKFNGKTYKREHCLDVLSSFGIDYSLFDIIYDLMKDNVEFFKEAISVVRTDRRRSRVSDMLASDVFSADFLENKYFNSTFTSVSKGNRYAVYYDSVGMSYILFKMIRDVKYKGVLTISEKSKLNKVLGPLLGYNYICIEMSKETIKSLISNETLNENSRRYDISTPMTILTIIEAKLKLTGVVGSYAEKPLEELLSDVGSNDIYVNTLLEAEHCRIGDSDVEYLSFMNKIGALDYMMRRVRLLYKSYIKSFHLDNKNYDKVFGDMPVKRLDEAGINPYFVKVLYESISVNGSNIGGIDPKCIYESFHSNLYHASEEGKEQLKNELTKENIDKLFVKASRAGVQFSTALCVVMEQISCFGNSFEWVMSNVFNTKAIEMNKALAGSGGIIRPLILLNLKLSVLNATLGVLPAMEYLSRHKYSTVHSRFDIDSSLYALEEKFKQGDMRKVLKHLKDITDRLFSINPSVSISIISSIIELGTNVSSRELLFKAMDEVMLSDNIDITNVEKALRKLKAEMTESTIRENCGISISETKPKRIDVVNVNNETDDLYVHFHKHDDIEVSLLGEITNCCQTFDGAAKTAVIEGIVNPYSGFISVRRKDNDKIVAQSWIWLTDDRKTLYLDSIESRYTGDVIKNVTKTICEWAKGQKYNIAIGAAWTKIDKEVATTNGFVYKTSKATSTKLTSVESFNEWLAANKEIFDLRASFSDNTGAFLKSYNLHSSTKEVFDVPDITQDAFRATSDNIYSDARGSIYVLEK